jgi:hypothetical protein
VEPEAVDADQVEIGSRDGSFVFCQTARSSRRTIAIFVSNSTAQRR